MESASGNTRVENVWMKNLEAAVVQSVAQMVVTLGDQMAAVQTATIRKPEVEVVPEVEPEVVVHLTKTFIGTFKRC